MHEEPDVLGNRGGVVADAFDVLGDEQQMGTGGNGGRFACHHVQQFAEGAGVQFVQFRIAAADFLGGVRVAVAVGGEYRQQQFGSKISQLAQIARGRHRGVLVQRGAALGQVRGVIADAFDRGGDAQRCHHFTQVACHRLAAGEQLQHVMADFLQQCVDGVVVGDHALRCAAVAAFQHVDGGVQLIGRQFPHADEFAGKAGQFLVVTFDDVGAHPNLPVM